MRKPVSIVKASRQLLLLLALIATGGGARDAHELRVELLQQINATQQRIESELLAQNNLEQQLRQIESELADIARELAQIQAKHKSSTERLAKLEQDYLHTDERVTQLERQLLEVVRSNYTHASYSPLRIILETSDARAWTRYLAYLRSLAAAQWQLTTQAQQARDRLKALIREQIGLQQSILSQSAAKQARQDKLEQLQTERSTTLQLGQTRLEGAQQQLSNYRRLEKRIEKLVLSIGELRLDEYALGAPFAELRGRLPLPVAGKAEFTSGKKPGIHIRADYGKAISAIAAGRVAYANWISGLGLVLILDHGEDYLSLYAHNQHFAASVGDWVQARQTVGYVGDSGGGNQPMLWLQLLHKGKPLQLESWFAPG